MRREFLITLYFTLIIVSLSACGIAEQSQKEASFQELSAIDIANSVIELTLPDAINDGKIGSNIIILMRINSNMPVYFPPNYNKKIYRYVETQKEWVEILDQMTHIPSDGNYSDDSLVCDSSIPDIIDVLPVIENVEEPITIRVVVTGYQKTQDGQKKYVGAYIDVPLQP